jgi:hypothetical protein
MTIYHAGSTWTIEYPVGDGKPDFTFTKNTGDLIRWKIPSSAELVVGKTYKIKVYHTSSTGTKSVTDGLLVYSPTLESTYKPTVTLVNSGSFTLRTPTFLIDNLELSSVDSLVSYIRLHFKNLSNNVITTVNRNELNLTMDQTTDGYHFIISSGEQLLANVAYEVTAEYYDTVRGTSAISDPITFTVGGIAPASLGHGVRYDDGMTVFACLGNHTYNKPSTYTNPITQIEIQAHCTSPSVTRTATINNPNLSGTPKEFLFALSASVGSDTASDANFSFRYRLTEAHYGTSGWSEYFPLPNKVPLSNAGIVAPSNNATGVDWDVLMQCSVPTTSSVPTALLGNWYNHLSTTWKVTQTDFTSPSHCNFVGTTGAERYSKTIAPSTTPLGAYQMRVDYVVQCRSGRTLTFSTTVHTFTAKAGSIGKPSITGHSHTLSGTDDTYTLNSSAFNPSPTTVNGSAWFVHQASRWVIKKGSTTLHDDWYTAANRLTQFVLLNLDHGDTYSVQVQYRGQDANGQTVSTISDVYTFAALAQRILKPTITSPASGASGIKPGDTIGISAFTTAPADITTHGSTEAEFTSTGDFSSPDFTIVTSGEDNLEVLTIGRIQPASSYQVRVRYTNKLINKPAITSHADGTVIPIHATIEASPPSSPVGINPIVSDWEAATDINFTNIIANHHNKNSLIQRLVTSDLPYGTSIYIRMRYKTAPLAYINKPVIASPANYSTVPNVLPTFTVQPMVAVDAGILSAVEWQMATRLDFLSMISTGMVTTGLTYTPTNDISAHRHAYVRCRFHTTYGFVSEWSDSRLYQMENELYIGAVIGNYVVADRADGKWLLAPTSAARQLIGTWGPDNTSGNTFAASLTDGAGNTEFMEGVSDSTPGYAAPWREPAVFKQVKARYQNHFIPAQNQLEAILTQFRNIGVLGRFVTPGLLDFIFASTGTGTTGARGFKVSNGNTFTSQSLISRDVSTRAIVATQVPIAVNINTIQPEKPLVFVDPTGVIGISRIVLMTDEYLHPFEHLVPFNQLRWQISVDSDFSSLWINTTTGNDTFAFTPLVSHSVLYVRAQYTGPSPYPTGPWSDTLTIDLT